VTSEKKAPVMLSYLFSYDTIVACLELVVLLFLTIRTMSHSGVFAEWMCSSQTKIVQPTSTCLPRELARPTNDIPGVSTFVKVRGDTSCRGGSSLALLTLIISCPLFAMSWGIRFVLVWWLSRGTTNGQAHGGRWDSWRKILLCTVWAHLRKSMTGKRSFPPNPMGSRNYGSTRALAGRLEVSRS